jgi:hydroxyethylthiazole kinase-like uncharacterized protein yjeF
MIEEVGLPSPVLMEHAAHGVADAILSRYGRVRFGVLCGPGNNGGDGWAVARHLHLAGVDVHAVPMMPPRSPEALVHHGVACSLGLVKDRLGEVDVVIDAVFGTGQRAPMGPPALDVPVPIVALDVPTGVDADTGVRLADWPRPDRIVTIGRLKPCLFVDPVPWEFVDIGLEERATEPPEAVLATRPRAPPVGLGANKWTRGHVGVLAGSAERAGAGVLACRGALRAGAGLVTLLAPREAWSRLGALPAEVMVATPDDAARADVLVVGPGLGRAEDARVRRLWAEDPRPMVVDADGLRALDATPSPHPRVITPHPGEAAALLGRDWRSLEADRLATARALGAIAPAVYKGACPIVSTTPLTVVWGAAPALGTAGSGDVLAGLIGALLCRLPPLEAAVLGAWAHAEAGRGLPVGALASDIADALPAVLRG